MANGVKGRCYYVPSDADRSGISVQYHVKARSLTIGGWYDSMVGLTSETISLRQFFDRLGITARDCHRAFKETE